MAESKTTMQICGKMGHIAINCWHHYEPQSQTNISAYHSQFLSIENSDMTSSILGTPSTLHDPL